MQLSDFDFDLPEELIATRPARPRSAARLLVASRSQMVDARVFELPRLLRAGDLLVLNDTRVIPARLDGVRRRETAQGHVEAGIEATLVEALGGGRWRALLKPLRKVRPGERLHFGAGLEAVCEAHEEGMARLAFNLEGAAFEAALAEAGAMPLPPYIAARRPPDAQDREDYQTVWAERPGSVAAPTASLHFDAPLLAALEAAGVRFARVTLHVGAGTFLPVKTEDISRHRMHAEWGEVSEAAAEAINATRRAGGRVIPVGTTALRVIESAAPEPGRVAPFRGETDIFIRPGYDFRIADGLMTNFHLPKSTLMMLVSALMGLERIRQIYAHAVAERYRFFSYGDASLLLPGGL
ncbi:S-adenosylmethionine:tRNA ribosyltransferase-isomerase [Meinhardsimonia xiamenensis]|jgi:S-adenosylmethionine:tRNA ribosyltransferase-isomerase|uniref:S-adenosylmethionine:tRNA ribosyltransferase-isomerase n=1 Tax=Meinhardsimonia xiamenensis TaxID=990712 RepID=A0A1G9GH01_9RHOB|nr:tRNA preQ1(34) S-adenosylmethionine ribosyltransferase-isomerase QueA [Meinhardsimonia xiamenensis]PRX31889.1 S-adenosylmethionine:tRNA ribosyltransferase-isomerase [Meinhardsimonia xiamenensis]SDK99951.1 S-adenosylmethionine:tRNA ribosyltransferase-isomerase [Meinhardsimonia xiamenensis]